jgi:hypothetical protein
MAKVNHLDGESAMGGLGMNGLLGRRMASSESSTSCIRRGEYDDMKVRGVSENQLLSLFYKGHELEVLSASDTSTGMLSLKAFSKSAKHFGTF